MKDWIKELCPEIADWQAELIAEEAMKKRLEPEQEPVAWQWLNTANFRKKLPADAEKGAWNPLYTNPPRREWRGLTEDELTALGIIHSRYQEESLETGGWFDFARAIEAELKERNA